MDCLNCKKTLSGRKSKRFCNRSCSAVYNNSLRTRTKSKCPQCGTKVIGQKFCSRKCVSVFNMAQIGECLSGKQQTISSKRTKKYLIQANGEKCMECGWNKRHPITNKVPIELEHIDGDSSNNHISNIKLLCPNCHSLTPTFKALNIGNGRHKRRLRYQQGKSF